MLFIGYGLPLTLIMALRSSMYWFPLESELVCLIFFGSFMHLYLGWLILEREEFEFSYQLYFWWRHIHVPSNPLLALSLNCHSIQSGCRAGSCWYQWPDALLKDRIFSVLVVHMFGGKFYLENAKRFHFVYSRSVTTICHCRLIILVEVLSDCNRIEDLFLFIVKTT